VLEGRTNPLVMPEKAGFKSTGSCRVFVVVLAAEGIAGVLMPGTLPAVNGQRMHKEAVGIVVNPNPCKYSKPFP